jgi:YD repeat-containing protein
MAKQGVACAQIVCARILRFSISQMQQVPRRLLSLRSVFSGHATLALRTLILLIIASTLTSTAPTWASGAKYVYDAAGRLVQVIAADGSSAQYSYDPAGNILSVTNIAASALAAVGFSNGTGAVGSTLTIYGSGFSTTLSCNQVSFNGVAATVTASTVNSITVIVPVGATSGSIDITQCDGGGTIATGSFNVIAPPNLAPTISSISPLIEIEGGTVSVSGENFRSVASGDIVNFNRNKYQALVSTASTTSLDVVVPYSATSGKISVTTPDGVANSAQDFFVVPFPHATSDVVATGRLTLGAPLSVTFTATNQVAMYLFEGVKGQRITTPIDSSVTDCSAAIGIVDPSGGSLTVSSIDCAGLSTMLKTTGTYTILVYPPQTAGAGDVSFTVNADNQYADLPGQNFGTVATTGAPTDVPLVGMNYGESKILKFNGSIGQLLSLQIANDAGDYYLLSILSPDYSEMMPATLFHQPALVHEMLLPQTGTYWIKITKLTTAAWGTLDVRIYPLLMVGGYTVLEPENSSEVVNIDTPGQDQFIVFNAVVGKSFAVQTTMPESGGLSPYVIEVAKPDGSLALPQTYETGGDFLGPFKATQANQSGGAIGTYQIAIHSFKGATGALQVQVYWPEDTTEAVDNAGTATTVSLDTPGQSGDLTFDGTAGQLISLQVTADTLAYYNITILNPDGSEFLSPQFENGSVFLGPFTPAQTGTYTVRVSSYYGSIGSLQVQVYSQPDVVEEVPTTGDITTVNLTSPGQAGNLTFEGTAGQRISFQTSNPLLGYYYVTVLNPDGSMLFPLTFQTGSYFGGPYTLTQNGTYTIRITQFNNGLGSVQVQVFDVPDDTTGTVATTGDPATVTLGTPGQAGELTFVGAAGQKISVAVSGTLADGYITILNPNGSVLQFYYGAGFLGSFTLPQAGAYRVRIGGAGETGSLQVRVYTVVDTTATVVTTGDPTTVTIDTPGQTANLTFEGTEGQRISLVTSNGTLADDWVAILNPDGSVLNPDYGAFYSGCGAVDAANLCGVYTLSQAGTYSVTVTSHSTGSLQVQVYVVEDVSGTVSTTGDASTVNLGTPGQAGALTFDAVAGQEVSFATSNVSFEKYYIRIQNPDGTELLGLSSENGAISLDPYTLTQTGTYTVKIAQIKGGTGSLDLQVNTIPPVMATMTPPTPIVDVTVTIDTPDQPGNLTFNGTAGQRVTLLTGDGMPSTFDVTVLNPDGSTLLDAPYNYGQSFIDLGTLTQTGAYSIAIYGDDSSTGSLQVRGYSVPATTTATVETTGDPATVILNTPGQASSLTFDGAAGQRISLMTSNGSLQNYVVTILNPDGSALQESGAGQGKTLFGVYVLEQTGTYTIAITGDYGSTGAMQVRVYSVPPDVVATLPESGEPVTVTLTTPGQAAHLTFGNSANYAYPTLQTSNNTLGTYDLEFLDPNGSAMRPNWVPYSWWWWQPETVFNSDFSTDYLLNVTGTYTITIKGDNGRTGSLQVKLLPDPMAPVIPL